MVPSRVLVKICGLTRVDEAVACARLGADWIGLNFHPPSPRSILPKLAAEIVAALPEGATPVGVFVDRPPAEVAEIADRVGLRIVQLHGDEPIEDLSALRDWPVVRAFRIRTVDDWSAVARFVESAEAMGHPLAGVLVDAYVPGLPGGTGLAIDWTLLDVAPPLPRMILAGGLTPENVAERVARVRPWMVDIASGVESSPGRKNLEAVDALVRSVRSVRVAPTPPESREPTVDNPPAAGLV